MSSANVLAAEAVLDTINAAVMAETVSQVFTAERAYVPKFVLEDAVPKGLQVFVCPVTHNNQNYTRDSNINSCGVVVSVIKKLTDLSNEEIDPLVELVEQLKNLLSGTLVIDGEHAALNLSDEPIYRPDVMTSQRTFWGMFTVSVVFPR